MARVLLSKDSRRVLLIRSSCLDLQRSTYFHSVEASTLSYELAICSVVNVYRAMNVAHVSRLSCCVRTNDELASREVSKRSMTGPEDFPTVYTSKQLTRERSAAKDHTKTYAPEYE